MALVHPDLITAAKDAADGAVADGLLTDGKVARCGDDISLIMTHEHGADAEAVHAFAWDTFLRTGLSIMSHRAVRDEE